MDRIDDVGGSLRFAERIVACDSGHFDTLVAIPLQYGGESFVALAEGLQNALWALAGSCRERRGSPPRGRRRRPASAIGAAGFKGA
ncbi:MAG: hypothetical protein WA709_10645 [Stellaceae bacterium]